MSIIDCCVRASASDDEIVRFLPEGWRSYFTAHVPPAWHDYFLGLAEMPDRALRGSPIDVALEYRNPLGDHSGPGDLAGVRGHLATNGIDRALVMPSDKLVLSAGIPTVNVAIAATRAVNDWLVAEWAEQDERLKAVIVVPTQAPDAASAEIRRWAGHGGLGGILLAAGGLGKPFGHPVFDPIHAAAEEADVPVVLLAGGDAAVDSGSYPVAGGFPGTYAELRTLAHQALESHVASLIGLGVVNRYPRLRFLALGGGITWLVPWLWRLDVNYKAFRYDVVWTKGERPSDLFRRHFLVGTHPLVRRADLAAFQRYLSIDPILADLVCYASGYPDWACVNVGDVETDVPAAWVDGVLEGNLRRLLGTHAEVEA